VSAVSGSLALTGTVDLDRAVRFAFSDIADGNMSLAVGSPDGAARERLAVAIDVAPEQLVFMQQVHGPQVAVVGTAHQGRGLRAHADGIPAVDALVTFDTGVALAVLVADCVPVVICDPQRSVAVIHAGRGGVASGVVAAAVAQMTPPAPERLRAIIGPAIGGCCYEVEPELADQVAATVPAARSTTSWGTAALDLPAAVDAQLRELGVTGVQRVGGCTRCDGERWFSHRRVPGRGRQAGAVVRSAPVDAPVDERRQAGEARYG
jgi:YfiH family protein